MTAVLVAATAIVAARTWAQNLIVAVCLTVGLLAAIAAIWIASAYDKKHADKPFLWETRWRVMASWIEARAKEAEAAHSLEHAESIEASFRNEVTYVAEFARLTIEDSAAYAPLYVSTYRVNPKDKIDKIRKDLSGSIRQVIDRMMLIGTHVRNNPSALLPSSLPNTDTINANLTKVQR